jgi:hypothetical protein
VLGALKNKSNDAMKLNAVSISAPKKLSFCIIQISAQNQRLFPRASRAQHRAHGFAVLLVRPSSKLRAITPSLLISITTSIAESEK